MSGKLKDKIEYAMLCVSKFAQKNSLSQQEACRYLHKYGGLDFLDRTYEIESTFSPRIVVEDLLAVCRNNGGTLA